MEPGVELRTPAGERSGTPGSNLRFCSTPEGRPSTWLLTGH